MRGEDVTNPIPSVRLWPSQEGFWDQRCCHKAGSVASQAHLEAGVFLAHIKAYFAFPSLTKSHTISCCLFLFYLSPCFDSTRQQSWTWDPVEIHIQHVNASPASSVVLRATILGALHFHKHCLRCVLALPVLQMHLYKTSYQL